MLKYGVHALLFSDTFDEKTFHILEKVKRIGYDGLEIPIFQPETVNAVKIREAFRSVGLKATFGTALNLSQNIISPDKAVRENGIKFFKDSIRVIDQFEDVGVRNFGGVIYAAWSNLVERSRTEEEWKLCVNSLKEVCRFAQDYDVTISIEPVNRFETYFINTSEDAVKLANDIGEPNAKVLLDTFHMNIEEKNFYDPIKKCGALLSHVHTCENDRGVPGTGHVNWDEVFKALYDIKYNGWVVVESFVFESKVMASATAIWRPIAPSADAIAAGGLYFLKSMERKHSR